MGSSAWREHLRGWLKKCSSYHCSPEGDGQCSFPWRVTTAALAWPCQSVGIHSSAMKLETNVTDEELTVSSKVEKLHKELMEDMDNRRIPRKSSMLSLLKHCSTSEDIKLGLEAVARLRTTRAVQGRQHANFGTTLSELVVDACIRAKDPHTAMKTLWAHNLYGFTPSLVAAHQLLVYGREQEDISLVQNVLDTMVANGLSPTRSTADIVLRLCKEQDKEDLMFSLARKFYMNGVRFRPALYDVCISTAANAGEIKHVLEVQKWRSDLNLSQTLPTIFASAKVLVLQGKPKKAAQLIHTYEQNVEAKNMYLRVMVRAWPAEVLSRHKKTVSEVKLKKDLFAMVKELKTLDYRILVDAEHEFGRGTETLKKVVYT